MHKVRPPSKNELEEIKFELIETNGDLNAAIHELDATKDERTLSTPYSCDGTKNVTAWNSRLKREFKREKEKARRCEDDHEKLEQLKKQWSSLSNIHSHADIK
ncbi:hypothetical protein G6011_07739 [Alternaria panax]|uniref:Uncharacterized protein n=1 Tax=Alternaria panax TaxID=48097 RepID=A0AAD4F962_9PLEO|nr:hypothetical protein G6011_07739 [Alternaria panax]